VMCIYSDSRKLKLDAYTYVVSKIEVVLIYTVG